MVLHVLSGAPDDLSGVNVMVFIAVSGVHVEGFGCEWHTLTRFRVLTPFGVYIIKRHPRRVEHVRGIPAGCLNIVLGPLSPHGNDMGACPFWKNFRSGTVGLRCVASRPVSVSRYSRVHIVIDIGIINNCLSALRKFLAVGIAGKILGLPITASRRYESFFQFVSHLLFFQLVSNLL